MTDKCTRCGGLQYVTRAAGEFAAAEVCACVTACVRCSGLGYVFQENDKGYTYAVECRCHGLAERVRRFNEAQVPALHRDSTLERYEERGGNQREIRFEFLKYRQDFRLGAPGMVLSGPPGTGKTHLMVALIRHFTFERGIRCRYMDFGHLLHQIKQGYDQGRSEAEIVNDLATEPLLCIDELGKGRASEWEIQVLDGLVNRRYVAGLTTLFTTNYPLKAPASAKDPARAKRRTGARGQMVPGDEIGTMKNELADMKQMMEEIGLRSPETAGEIDALRALMRLETIEQRVGSRIFSRLSEMCLLRTVTAEDIRKTDGPKRWASKTK